jgi:hypothetical protein
MDVYWILFTFFAFCVGPPLALYGYKLFKPMFAIVGFLVGFAIAIGVINSLSGNVVIVSIGGFFGGLAGLLIANMCAFLLIYFLGFKVGLLLIGLPMMAAFNFFGIAHPLFLSLLYVVAVIGGLIGGTYANTGRRPVVIAWSSLTGSIFVVFGFMMLLYHRTYAQAPANLGSLIDFAVLFSPQHALIILVGIILFIDSLRFQFNTTRHLPPLDLSNPFGGLNAVGTGRRHGRR